MTTPNREYNARFENLQPGGLRHGDHGKVKPIGEEDATLGAPTQMAVLRRGEEAE